MGKRSVFYITVFTAVAAVGFINVATGGLITHLAVDYSPYHSLGDPVIEAEEMNLTDSDSTEITVYNVERFSYSMSMDAENTTERPPVPNFEFTPSPSVTMESLPPTWIWNFQTPSVKASVSFDTNDVAPGTYRYVLEAYGKEDAVEKELMLYVE